MTAQSPPSSSVRCGLQALSVVRKVWDIDFSRSKSMGSSPINSPTRKRRSESLSETPFDVVQILEDVRCNKIASKEEGTVLYLAYGSNLSAEKFKGSRGIMPISQVSVLVPELELTFDLPGVPYTEPCFANTRYRSPADSSAVGNSDYHKDRWHKGLVGVVYEVTKTDYATIIASEGGGAGYQDIIVQCYEIPEGTKEVDPCPTTTPFKAHTLFAPALPPTPPGSPPPKSGGRISRPDSSYAQPSARYLKLITDGAEEHKLPDEYKKFLYELRPYTITSVRQKLGQFIFLSVWMPIIAAMFGMSRLFVDKKGRAPKWMVAFMSAVFTGVWVSYDRFFKKLFGDGERTQKNTRDEEALKQGPFEKEPLLNKKRMLAENQ